MQKRDDERKSVFSNIVDKASTMGKKLTIGIKNSAKNKSEKNKKNRTDKMLKKFNPLFPDVFQSSDFKIPNVIQIVDDAQRRGIEVCEGAIGWLEKIHDVEILCLYDEYIAASNIRFIPFAKCDSVYCVDPFDRHQFINVDTTFERTTNEKLAELEHIAYCLGAKSCSVQIMEDVSQHSALGFAAKTKKVKVEADNVNQRSNMQSVKSVSCFEGDNAPKPPKLKWFAFDENVKGLIDMRCAGENLIKSKVLEICCSSSATMSQKTAIAIDKIKNISGVASAESKAIKESNSKLIFEVKF